MILLQRKKRFSSAVKAGAIAETAVASTEFIYSPRIGCQPWQREGFLKYFSLEKKMEFYPMVVKKLPSAKAGPQEECAYVSWVGQGTDDAERVFSNLHLLVETQNFKDMSDEEIQRCIWNDHKEWSKTSVYQGLNMRSVFSEPTNFEDFQQRWANPEFVAHKRLSLGVMMQAGPFCIFPTSHQVKLLGTMMNNHPIAMEALEFQYNIYRGLLFSFEREKVLEHAQALLKEEILIQAVKEAKMGNVQGLLLVPNMECVHAVFAMVYVLMRAESFVHGVNLGLYLALDTECYDTDTIAQINGFMLGMIFPDFDNEIPQLFDAWQKCDPHGGIFVLDDMMHTYHISKEHAKEIAEGLPLKPLRKEKERWTQKNIDKVLSQVFIE